MSQVLTLGYSPCPNDTYIFHALASGELSLDSHQFEISLFDVETLNQMALDSKLDITKLSFFSWLTVKDRYKLLNSGGALGYGCGPILVSKHTVRKSELPDCKIAIPGKWTTAHLLFQLWAPTAKNKLFISYENIFQSVSSGEADCGVIIHESRFTYAKEGFQSIIDLGAWWEKLTGLPIPLGCIAAKRTLGSSLLNKLDIIIKESIRFAHQNPDGVMPYIRKYAQEMDDDILRQHIDTFVNEYSIDLGKIGRRAVDTLEKMAKSKGIIK